MGDFNAQIDSINGGYEDVICTNTAEITMGTECSVSAVAKVLKLEAVFFNTRIYIKELGDHLTVGQ